MALILPKIQKKLFEGIKITCLDVHPVLSYVCFVIEPDKICIFDYENERIVLDVKLSGLYSRFNRELDKLRSNLEMYEVLNIPLPEWYTPDKRSALHMQFDDHKFGKILGIKFHDSNIAFWKYRNISEMEVKSHIVNERQRIIEMRRINELKHLVELDKSLMAIYTSNRVILLCYKNVDSITSILECKSSVRLENKDISCVEFLNTRSTIVIGGSDGCIRFWNYGRGSGKVVLEKNKIHSKTITKMIVVNRDDPVSSLPYLLSCSSNGTLSFWYIDKKRSVFSKKIHSSAVLDMLYCEPEDCVITMGGDRNICITNLKTGEVKKRISLKDDFKKIKANLRAMELITAVHYIPNWIVLSGAHSIIYVMSTELSTASIAKFDFKLKEKKRKMKILQVRSVISQRNLLFVACTNGILLFRFRCGNISTPQIEQSIYSEDFVRSIRRSVFYIRESILYKRTVDEEKLELMKPEKIDVKVIGNCLLSTSRTSGNILGLLNSKERTLRLIDIRHTPPKPVFKKTEVLSIVWDFYSENFSVIEKKKSQNFSIVFYKDRQVLKKIESKKEVLFGGKYCGVEEDGKLVFYKFENGEKLRGSFISPVPRIVEWDIASDFFVVVYDKSFAVMKVNTENNEYEMTNLCVNEKIKSCTWVSGTLFAVTSQCIKMYFPNMNSENPNQVLEEVIIASLDIESNLISSKKSGSFETAPYPMIPGQLRICGLFGENLHVINNHSQIFKLPLRSYIVKFKMCVQSGKLDDAIKWLEYIPMECIFMDLTNFLIARGHASVIKDIASLSPSYRFEHEVVFGEVKPAYRLLVKCAEQGNVNRKEFSDMCLKLAMKVEKRKQAGTAKPREEEILKFCYKNSFVDVGMDGNLKKLVGVLAGNDNAKPVDLKKKYENYVEFEQVEQ